MDEKTETGVSEPYRPFLNMLPKIVPDMHWKY